MLRNMDLRQRDIIKMKKLKKILEAVGAIRQEPKRRDVMPSDYSLLTVREIKDLLRQRNIPFGSRDIKNTLLEKLRNPPKQEEAPIDFSRLTVPKIKEILKQQNIPFKSRDKKNILLEKLTTPQEVINVIETKEKKTKKPKIESKIKEAVQIGKKATDTAFGIVRQGDKQLEDDIKKITKRHEKGKKITKIIEEKIKTTKQEEESEKKNRRSSQDEIEIKIEEEKFEEIKKKIIASSHNTKNKKINVRIPSDDDILFGKVFRGNVSPTTFIELILSRLPGPLEEFWKYWNIKEEIPNNVGNLHRILQRYNIPFNFIPFSVYKVVYPHTREAFESQLVIFPHKILEKINQIIDGKIKQGHKFLKYPTFEDAFTGLYDPEIKTLEDAAKVYTAEVKSAYEDQNMVTPRPQMLNGLLNYWGIPYKQTDTPENKIKKLANYAIPYEFMPNSALSRRPNLSELAPHKRSEFHMRKFRTNRTLEPQEEKQVKKDLEIEEKEKERKIKEDEKFEEIKKIIVAKSHNTKNKKINVRIPSDDDILFGKYMPYVKSFAGLVKFELSDHIEVVKEFWKYWNIKEDIPTDRKEIPKILSKYNIPFDFLPQSVNRVDILLSDGGHRILSEILPHMTLDRIKQIIDKKRKQGKQFLKYPTFEDSFIGFFDPGIKTLKDVTNMYTAEVISNSDRRTILTPPPLMLNALLEYWGIPYKQTDEPGVKIKKLENYAIPYEFMPNSALSHRPNLKVHALTRRSEFRLRNDPFDPTKIER